MKDQSISKLSEIVINDIERLFDYFGIKYCGQNKIYMRCCIHDGDNKNALSIYLPNNGYPFIWKCWTHHCEDSFSKSVIGFVRALISSTKYEWRSCNDKKASVKETINFLMQLYQVDQKDLVITESYKDKKEFLQQSPKVYHTRNIVGIPREVVRNKLIIPPEYYLKRGYSKEILDKYDVGLCKKKDKEMNNRVVVPIYEETGKFMVGCIGRTITNIEPKWKFNGEVGKSCLYNYWFSKDKIKKDHTAILVESPGNVWRLEEAGYHNAVAVLGSELTMEQEFLLEKIGVMNLILIFDNDKNKAGQEAAGRIQKKCDKFYNIKKVEIPKEDCDIGDLSVQQVQNLLRGI